MAVLPLTGKPVLIRSSEKATMTAVIHSLHSVARVSVWVKMQTLDKMPVAVQMYCQPFAPINI